MKTQSPLFIEGRQQRQLTVTTVAQTPVLAGGIYAVWATGDMHIKVDEVANDVTATTGYLLRASETILIAVESGRKIGAVAGTSGTLNYHQVGE